MPKKDRLSLLQTQVSTRRSPSSRWSSACSLDDHASVHSVDFKSSKIRSKIGKARLPKLQKTFSLNFSTVEFRTNGQTCLRSFPCFQEDKVLSFPAHLKPRLRRLTEDFDVESSDEVIADAVKLQCRKVLRVFNDLRGKEKV